jgi:hypothetical protein
MPSRPAELDRLNDFIGTWEMEGEAKFAMLDEPLKVSGRSQMEWGGDRWFVIGRGTMNMQHFNPVQMLETWSYDVHDKKFRSTWVDSMGMTGMGKSTFDEDDQVWRMKARGFGPWGESNMTGTLRFVNPDTMEWTMEEHSGFMKVMEMTGTSKRVR